MVSPPVPGPPPGGKHKGPTVGCVDPCYTPVWSTRTEDADPWSAGSRGPRGPGFVLRGTSPQGGRSWKAQGLLVETVGMERWERGMGDGGWGAAQREGGRGWGPRGGREPRSLRAPGLGTLPASTLAACLCLQPSFRYVFFPKALARVHSMPGSWWAGGTEHGSCRRAGRLPGRARVCSDGGGAEGRGEGLGWEQGL